MRNPKSGHRTRFVTAKTSPTAAVWIMPGKKASSARPDRSAKNAAMATATAAYPRKRSVSRRSSLSRPRTTRAAAAARTAARTSWVTVQTTTNAIVGTADSSAPRQPPMATVSRARSSSSTVT